MKGKSRCRSIISERTETDRNDTPSEKIIDTVAVWLMVIEQDVLARVFQGQFRTISFPRKSGIGRFSRVAAPTSPAREVWLLGMHHSVAAEQPRKLVHWGHDPECRVVHFRLKCGIR